MASITATIVEVIGLVFLTLVLPAYQEKTECYVCQYSPKNNKTEDVCTSDNFRTTVNTVECERGCERVSQWNNNGVLEHFHRNCYKDNTSTPGKCTKTENKSFSRDICVCTSNLCNTAITIQGYTWTSFLLTIIITIMAGLWIG